MDRLCYSYFRCLIISKIAKVFRQRLIKFSKFSKPITKTSLTWVFIQVEFFRHSPTLKSAFNKSKHLLITIFLKIHSSFKFYKLWKHKTETSQGGFQDFNLSMHQVNRIWMVKKYRLSMFNVKFAKISSKNRKLDPSKMTFKVFQI